MRAGVEQDDDWDAIGGASDTAPAPVTISLATDIRTGHMLSSILPLPALTGVMHRRLWVKKGIAKRPSRAGTEDLLYDESVCSALASRGTSQ